MRTQIILFSLVAAVIAAVTNAASIAVQEEGPFFASVFKSALEKVLYKKAEAFIRTILKENEPFSIPINPELKFRNESLDAELTAHLMNSKLSNTSNFQVNYIRSGLPQAWAKFEVVFPEVLMDGDYVVDGYYGSKRVIGEGQFSVTIRNIVKTGQIEANTEGVVELRRIDLDYDFEDFNVNVKFSTPHKNCYTEIIQKVLASPQLSQYLRSRKKEVAAAIANYVKKRANMILEGRSQVELINWLEQSMK